ncbi:NmrA family NAD(P)-binding protein [Streptomyces sp. NPDC059788]|uniref:NmrA family NAD(P)-binding protein n=1 Tax=Streptomyces sp. NPDC059788 TaxID=3346948 RepID=UPI00364D7329
MTSGWSVRALTRNPAGPAARSLAAAGADVRAADMADPIALGAALEGPYGVFSVQPAPGTPGLPPEYGRQEEIRHGRSVADAALAAGARLLVYTSANSAQLHSSVSVLESKGAIEAHIRTLGIPATVLRPTSFMENYAHPVWGLRDGTLPSAIAPEVPQQLIALDDIAALAALAFANHGRFAGQALELAGDALTPVENASAISRATGHTVPYVRIPMDTLRELSPEAAEGIQWLNDRRSFAVDIDALRALHPGLLTFEAWLHQGGTTLLKRLLDQRSGNDPRSSSAPPR